jgi:hypothetical protein
MSACAIMHMIVESEHDGHQLHDLECDFMGPLFCSQLFLDIHVQICDKDVRPNYKMV